MQSRNRTLFVLDLHGNLRPRLQVLAGWVFPAFGVRPDYVSFLARRNQLLELPTTAGIDLPAGLLVARPADLHSDAAHRTVVRSPHGAKDHGISFLLGRFAGLEKDAAEEEPGKGERECEDTTPGSAAVRNSRHPRFLPLPHPHTLLLRP